MEKKQAFHGSDLEKIEKIYGIKKEDIIPFGGNVNPLGISPLKAEHGRTPGLCLRISGQRL